MIAGVLQRNRRLARALLIYATVLGSLVFAYTQVDTADLLGHWLRYNAEASGFLAGLFGANVEVSESWLLSRSFSFVVIEQCMPLASLAIFTAAVVTYPAPLFRKLWGIAIGAVVLSAINLVRITSPFFIGTTYPEALEVSHVLVWQSVMIIVSAVVWLIWMRGYSEGANNT